MNNTSIQMIEFCILDDETLRYIRSEFAREITVSRWIWKDFPSDLQQQ